MTNPRFLLIAFPTQGHINPSLQFAKRLIRTGAHVTLAITVSARSRMTNNSFPDGLSFATFSDSYDDGLKSGSDDPGRYMSEFRSRGSQALADLIQGAADDGRPFVCLVYTMLLSWAAEVARAHSLPAAILWPQPAAVLDIYYYYFNGYADVFSHCNDATSLIELPGLPPLTGRDLPSFLHPANPHTFLLPMFEEELEKLNQEVNPKVLVNTFDALEPEALRSISDKFNMFAIGPLIPSAFLDGVDPFDTTFGGDLFHGGEDHIEWLNSKPESSVVYVSFGTISVLSKPQMEAIARGLLACGRPFLWVIRINQENEPKDTEKHNLISCREELEKQGKIVSWCSQIQLLSHPSVGCFLTHCGWNSILESLSSGMPVVAFPQWTDQGTNAKLIEDVWRTGVRVMANEEGIVEGEEIRRCLDLVMGSGELADQIKRNAEKWKDLARDAAKAGGSSDKSLNAFVHDFRGRSFS